MTLEDKLIHVPLFTFEPTPYPFQGEDGWGFTHLSDDKYRLHLHPDLKKIAQLRSNGWHHIKRNAANAVLAVIDRLITEETTLLTSHLEGTPVTILTPNTREDYFIAGAIFHLSGRVAISVAQCAWPYFKPQIDKILASTYWAFQADMGNPRAQSHLRDLPRPVSFMNMLHAGSNQSRNQEFSSLQEYLANGQGLLEKGTIIRDVEITGFHGKSKSGTVSINNRTIRVPGSSSGDVISLRITDQLTGNLYKAESLPTTLEQGI